MGDIKHLHSKLQKQNTKNLRNNPTDAESHLWQYLKNSQFKNLKFKRQQLLGQYIIDFLCCSEKLIIELDGGQHNENIEYNEKRDNFLKNEGYKIIRIWNNNILNNIEGVLEYLDSMTKHLPLTPPLKREEKPSLKSLENTLYTHELEGGCKIQCPAKINLTLKIVNKREDGFHNIESIMQTISLFDYLTITTEPAKDFEINLSGNNAEIPYNENNLVYKATKLFLENTNLQPRKINIFIEKNIPIAAGLAGGSSNAAGTIFGLNEIFNKPLNKTQLHQICAQLGSDLNLCLEGGKQMTSGRGEILERLEFEEFNLSLIKPKNLGISAKEAYTKFSQKLQTPTPQKGKYLNDLEWAIIDDYPELQKIKELYPTSLMSGSGSTYFMIGKNFEPLDGYEIFNNLKAIPTGVCIKKDP